MSCSVTSYMNQTRKVGKLSRLCSKDLNHLFHKAACAWRIGRSYNDRGWGKKHLPNRAQYPLLLNFGNKPRITGRRLKADFECIT